MATLPFLEHQPDHFDHLNPLTNPTTLPHLNGIPLRAPWPLWPPPRPWPLWSTWAWAGHRVAKFTMKLPKTTIRKSYKRIGLSCNIWFLSPFLKLPRTIIWKNELLQGMTIYKGWGLTASLEQIVRFGGNLSQLFRHIPWTPLPSFPQIPLLEKSTLKG